MKVSHVKQPPRLAEHAAPELYWALAEAIETTLIYPDCDPGLIETENDLGDCPDTRCAEFGCMALKAGNWREALAKARVAAPDPPPPAPGTTRRGLGDPLRDRRDAALDVARYALARILAGDPDPRRLAEKALADIETLGKGGC